MNDNQSITQRVFISHKGKDKKAAMKIDRILRKAGGVNLRTFLSERIDAGIEWSPKILDKLKRADWLVLLYTDPSEEWDWCLFEAGFFAGGGGAGLICLHAANVPRPEPLKQWKSVRIDDVDEMKTFLQTLLEKINPALFETEEDLQEVIEDLKIAFLNTVRRKVDSEWNTEFVLINFKNPDQVKILDETGRVPNDVSCGEEKRESLKIFGHRTGECTMDTIQEGLDIHLRSWWLKALGLALRAASLKKYPIPRIPRIYSPHTKQEYHVVLHRVDRFSDDTLTFCLLFIERVPELVGEKDKKLKLASNMLRIGRLFRWEILEKYHGEVSRLKAKEAQGKKIKDCLENLALSIDWVSHVAERMELYTQDDVFTLFEEKEDKDEVERIVKLWPELFQRLSKVIEVKDLDGVLHALKEMLTLNRDFMVRCAASYLNLWEKID